MSYELINKELGIYACNETDITKNKANIPEKLLKSFGRLENLAVFTNGGRIVILNKDHKDFDEYKTITFSYMGASPYEREQLKNNLTNNSFASCIDLLDTAIEASTIDINTMEGWNGYVRKRHIKTLKGKGIEPTEKNLRSYQEEVNRQVEKQVRHLPKYSVPIKYTI